MVNFKFPVYLTGFLKCRNRPETRKIAQKCARGRHTDLAFTVFELTTIAAYRKSTIY